MLNAQDNVSHVATIGVSKEHERFMEYYLRSYFHLHDFVTLQSIEAAEKADLVQQALEIAWRRFGKMRSEQLEPSWLSKIARNIHKSEKRRARRRHAISGQSGFQLAPAMRLRKELRPLTDGLTPVELDVYRSQVRESLAEILRSLPARLSVVFSLRVDGYTYTEIGQRLGISKQAVRGRMLYAIRYASKHLRRSLNLAM